MSDFDVDLFVIGAGSGGVRCARIAAGYGARVMIAEEFRIGGTCVIRGCVPKKLYVYASRFADEFEDAAGFGWTIPHAPQFDWRTLVDAKEKEITRLSGLYRKGLDGAKVEIVESRAVVEGPHEVRILADGRIVRAKYILVATGGAPTREPGGPGVEHAITSDEIFDLPEFPKRLFVVGGGYIALEFASVFARLGAQVDVSMRADNILRGFDEDVRTGLRDALAHAGVRFHFGTLPTSYEKSGDGLRVNLANGESLLVDQALVATGRRPHTAGLGLEKAGVELRANGAVKVDALSRTSAPSVFAVGDVTDLNNLTPVAIREGHTLADRLFGGKDVVCDHEIDSHRRLHDAGGRRRRPHGAGGARALQGRGHLQGFVPADAGHALRARGKGADEGRRRRGHGQGPWRPHHRARRRRDDPACWNRHEDGRDKGRFRRHDGGASDRGRGTRHHADPDRSPRTPERLIWLISQLRDCSCISADFQGSAGRRGPFLQW